MTQASDTVVERLDRATQELLIEQVREVKRLSPMTVQRTPGGKLMRVRVTSAGTWGWVGDGAYRYTRLDGRGHPWPAIPELWLEIATRLGGNVAWDSAILNWYAADAALGWHVDKSERDRTLPIVTISLGDDASWAIRRDKDAPASRCRVVSGDVTLLEGETRGWEHTIERVYKRGRYDAQAGMFAPSPSPPPTAVGAARPRLDHHPASWLRNIRARRWYRGSPMATKTDNLESAFAERVILTFAPESRGFLLDPGSMLNGERVREGHRFAVLDVEGETLGTGPSRAEAAEAACMREVKWWLDHAKHLEDRLRRVMAAVETLSSGGAP